MSTTPEARCPSLNNMTSNPVILTVETLKLLHLDSYNRSVGAVVQVSCSNSLKLYGSPNVTCQENLTWTSQPKCDTPPPKPVPVMSEKTKLLIGLSSIGGFLVLLTLIAIVYSLLRKQKKEGDDYKHMQNGSLYNSTNSVQLDSHRYSDVNDADFYGPKTYPPSTKRNENIHMTPVTLPQNKSEWEVMETTALPRFSSNRSLDAPSNLKKKKYEFEEFNVYALRQGRDPFLWRPVVANMHFDN